MHNNDNTALDGVDFRLVHADGHEVTERVHSAGKHVPKGAVQVQGDVVRPQAPIPKGRLALGGRLVRQYVWTCVGRK